MKEEKILLTVKELCDYLGLGETKVREILHDPSNNFTVRIGYRIYAHKRRLDQWLDLLAETKRIA